MSLLETLISTLPYALILIAALLIGVVWLDPSRDVRPAWARKLYRRIKP